MRSTLNFALRHAGTPFKLLQVPWACRSSLSPASVTLRFASTSASLRLLKTLTLPKALAAPRSCSKKREPYGKYRDKMLIGLQYDLLMVQGEFEAATAELAELRARRATAAADLKVAVDVAVAAALAKERVLSGATGSARGVS